MAFYFSITFQSGTLLETGIQLESGILFFNHLPMWHSIRDWHSTGEWHSNRENTVIMVDIFSTNFIKYFIEEFKYFLNSFYIDVAICSDL